MSLTDKQRGAFHVWCRMCADHLNKIGFLRHDVLDPNKTFPWTMMDFKHFIYKDVLNKITGKKSTEDQSSSEPGEIYLIISSHIHTEYGIQLPPWPSYR